MSFSRSRNSAALTVSDVRPEREITAAATPDESANTRVGCSSSAEAAIARARLPVIILQEPAAASAKEELEPQPMNTNSVASWKYWHWRSSDAGRCNATT